MGIVLSKIPGVVVKGISRTTMPEYKGKLFLGKKTYKSQLSDNVKIIRDNTGVIHVYSSTYHDLLFGQGFVTAQERLFSLVITRRVAKGKLAEIKPEALIVDRITRTFGFYRLGKSDAQQISKEERKKVQAFCNGLNCYINSSAYKPPIVVLLAKMPKPEPFEVADILAITRLICWQMSRGLLSKVISIFCQQYLGKDAQELKYSNIRKLSFESIYDFLKLSDVIEKGGSNSWVVSGKHTASGSPIFENDPHLSLKSPSVFLQLHLVCENEGIDAAGFAITGLYGLQVAHNQHIAYGVTISYSDVYDLYIEDINPKDKNQYKCGNSYKDFDVSKEVIRVLDMSKKKDKKKKERSYTEFVEVVRRTKNGVVLSGVLDFQDKDGKNFHTYSVRGISLEQFAPNKITKILDLMLCKNWGEWKDCLASSRETSLTFTYADIYGNIGCYCNGAIPNRSKVALKELGNPFPANNPDYVWKGFHKKNPFIYNPKCGYIICCNHDVFKDTYPHVFSNLYKNPSRANRIKELLDDLITKQKKPITLEDVDKIRLDTKMFNIDHMKSFMDVVIDKRKKEDELVIRAAAKILKQFDGNFTIHSVAASLFTVFQYEITEMLLEEVSGIKEVGLRKKLMGFGFSPKFLPLNEYFCGYELLLRKLYNKLPSQEKKREVVYSALVKTIERLETLIPISSYDSFKNSLSKSFKKKTKAQMKKMVKKQLRRYKYGKLHTATFPHALGEKIPSVNIGPIKVPGNFDTIFATGYNFDGAEFNCKHYPCCVLMVDMKDVKQQARSIITPGNSCHLTSPFFKDAVKPFFQGKLRKMLYTKEDIEKAKHSQFLIMLGAKEATMISQSEQSEFRVLIKSTDGSSKLEVGYDGVVDDNVDDIKSFIEQTKLEQQQEERLELEARKKKAEEKEKKKEKGTKEEGEVKKGETTEKEELKEEIEIVEENN